MESARENKKNDLDIIAELLKNLIDQCTPVADNYPFLKSYFEILTDIDTELAIGIRNAALLKRGFTVPLSVSQRQERLNRQVNNLNSEYAEQVKEHEEKVKELEWLKVEKNQEIMKKLLENTQITIDRIYQENPQLVQLAIQIQATKERLDALNIGFWGRFFSFFSPCCKNPSGFCCTSCSNKSKIQELSDQYAQQMQHFSTLASEHKKTRPENIASLEHEQNGLTITLREERKKKPKENPDASKKRLQLAKIHGQVNAHRQHHEGQVQPAIMLQYVRFYFCIKEINNAFMRQKTKPSPSQATQPNTITDAKTQDQAAFKLLFINADRELSKYRQKLHCQRRYANKYIHNYNSKNRFTDQDRVAILHGPTWLAQQDPKNRIGLNYDEVLARFFSTHRSPRAEDSPLDLHVDTSPSSATPSSSTTARSSPSISPHSANQTPTVTHSTLNSVRHPHQEHTRRAGSSSALSTDSTRPRTIAARPPTITTHQLQSYAEESDSPHSPHSLSSKR